MLWNANIMGCCCLFVGIMCGVSVWSFESMCVCGLDLYILICEGAYACVDVHV